ncbi:hypothetical protein CQA53_06960 [Helicobacter didelphidarum]|uniref:DUF904 domain-containing protein n=1 Tax=Helicobacter didelphidarum TaxID=2040648 RepID=A0A3D8IJY4_9HELI|nr:hypothetical protein [Helicobacter didelphidarum]RDU64974.1 hypothetical protein CQA53_06960 [Helicobacter didelphidarum]
MTENHYNTENTSIHTHANTSNIENNSTNKQANSNGVGLLSLINNVRYTLDSRHNKKIEELEFKLLEKEETIAELELEISTIKAQNEEKDIELFKLHEEINAGKQLLTQLLEKLEN